MTVTSKEQQGAFEEDHRARCAAKEFTEEVDNIRR
jgi:hypothetical protein